MTATDELGARLLAQMGPPGNGPGVYVLYLKGECMYVGQSAVVWRRLLNHKTREYDVATMIVQPHSQKRRFTEDFLIYFLKPRDNKQRGNITPKAYLTLQMIDPGPVSPASPHNCQGRDQCQYAIEYGHKGVVRCPKGMCAMPAQPLGEHDGR